MKSVKIVLSLLMFLTFPLIAMEQAPKRAAIAYDNVIRLVFMGKTGVGKSTIVNACYNFTKQKKWNDFPKLFPIATRFQPCNVEEYQNNKVEDHARGELGASAQFPSEYIFEGNGFIVNLIDCPGMADPRGIEEDEKNSEKIAKFLAKVGEFNALCIVLNGITNRYTAEEGYFIQQVKTIIPASAYNRIFILVTYTNIPNENVQAFAKSAGLPVENIFYFDNFGLTKEGHIDFSGIDLNEDTIVDLSDPFACPAELIIADQNKKRTAKKVRDSWPVNHREFFRILQLAKKLGKHSSKEMEKIYEIKKEKLKNEQAFYVEQVQLYKEKMILVKAICTQVLYLPKNQEVMNFPKKFKDANAITDEEYLEWANYIKQNHKKHIITFKGEDAKIAASLSSMKDEDLLEHLILALRKIIEGV